MSLLQTHRANRIKTLHAQEAAARKINLNTCRTTHERHRAYLNFYSYRMLKNRLVTGYEARYKTSPFTAE